MSKSAIKVTDEIEFIDDDGIQLIKQGEVYFFVLIPGTLNERTLQAFDETLPFALADYFNYGDARVTKH